MNTLGGDNRQRGRRCARCPRRVSRVLWAGAVTAVALTAAGCGPAGPELTHMTGETMGTTYMVKIVGLPDNIDAAQLRGEIEKRLDAVDGLMSTYKDESELSRLNRHNGGEWVAVSPQLHRVLAAARRIGRQSEGAFDVTVGPLVDLWNFGPHRQREFNVPEPDELDRAMQRVGLDRFELRDDPPAVRKARGDVYIDLSGIAKGYAVDRVADYLASRGIENYLVEVGGELRAAGNNRAGGPWRIGIEKPVADRRTVQRAVPLAGLAMATSGDYRNFHEREGRRYSHLLDPRTGRPVEHGLVSVTVLAPTGMEADAWATGLLVLGPRDGYNFAGQQGLAALLIERTGDGFRERATPEFEALTGRNLSEKDQR